MTRRRTIFDALADKFIELIDSYDVTRVLEKRERKPKALVIDTTAEDVSEKVERERKKTPER